MAPPPATATADTLISLKITVDGTTRRFKLPLRDLGAHHFEDKIRAFLQIPIDATVVIERYSDSATTYVTLSTENIAAYKQLYRAAKAKQKLKLRVTVNQPTEPKETLIPEPVTIEDAPEEEAQAAGQPALPPEAKKESENSTSIKIGEPAKPSANDDTSGVVETVIAPQTNRDFPSFVKQWRARGNPRIHLRRDANGVEFVDFMGPSTNTEPLITRDAPEDSSSDGPQAVSPATLASLMREACKRHVASIKEREEMANKEKETKVKPATKMELSPECVDAVVDAIDKIREKSKALKVASPQECSKRTFTVCCNSCDRAVPEAHFHCSICDDGDFDLCQMCVDFGISCYGEGHWLIKRTIVNGEIKCSSTQIAPKSVRPTPNSTSPKSTPPAVPSSTSELPIRLAPVPIPTNWHSDHSARTCNCCVREFPEADFVHCTTCDDYDLCKGCFAKNQHGHHPKHGFVPAVKGTVLDQHVSSQLAPGRNVRHNAICDGCDKYIRGVRHKCLDCPDWDYCSDCVKDASFIHANHRFVAIYEPLADRPLRTSTLLSRALHYGITCDGPLCLARGGPRYIVGERYKCAVCHDTDFCANCEASPANTHNKTHPLIKFKTPVRHVSVTTTGEHEDGQRLPTMGDRGARSRTSPTHSTEKPVPSFSSPDNTRVNIAACPVQTVVDVQPTEQPAFPLLNQDKSVEIKEELKEVKEEAGDVEVPTSLKPVKVNPTSEDLVAVFKWDTIRDGSILPRNHTFEQTWVLRNEGTVPWPAGCAVKFVGGDYMGAVDPAHPAGIHELVSASESTVCYNSLAPGQEFPFTVLMRTPDRDGKVISYWRLTTPEGIKFGHKLWCDVDVRAPVKAEALEPVIPDAIDTETEAETEAAPMPAAIERSQMIVPKLDHESPSASIHEDRVEANINADQPTLFGDVDDYETLDGHDEWDEDSVSGIMTDEEYEILDASDEEFLFEQQKPSKE